MRIIGHGIDIVEVARIASMLEAHGERFVTRCFTRAEAGYAESAHRRLAERYAVRVACKAAVLKALGTGWRVGSAWRDIAGRRPVVSCLAVGSSPSGRLIEESPPL